jgi:hypothetical protein
LSFFRTQNLEQTGFWPRIVTCYCAYEIELKLTCLGAPGAHFYLKSQQDIINIINVESTGDS